MVILHNFHPTSAIVLMLIWYLNTISTSATLTRNENTETDFSLNNAMNADKPSTFSARNKYDIFSGISSRRLSPRKIKPNNRMSKYPILTATRKATYGLNRRMDDVPLNKFQPTSKSFKIARLSFGKNNFLTGFGLGFLAFGLKKLLLPIFIGVQIMKSILIAMFLPSILGSVGKLVGKGVTTFAQSSGAPNFDGVGNENINEYDFKDNPVDFASTVPTNLLEAVPDPTGSESIYNTAWAYPPSGISANNMFNYNNQLLPYPNAANYLHPAASMMSGASQLFTVKPGSLFGYPVVLANNYAPNYGGKPVAVNRLTPKLKETSPNKYHWASFYSKDKTEDFKVFQTIPSSSHLLANYDPFYSPLLSRIDSVFKQLGYVTETCRERLVCNMYKEPSQYAPFSNLVSAQLSRELNELRKPSSKNPEILRFFRYMKAAKDGQENQSCEMLYSECTTSRAINERSPMVSTYYDINKLVHAR